MTTAEILRAAATEVRKGWVQHYLIDYRNRVCALGALYRVVTGDADRRLPNDHPAIVALTAYLPADTSRWRMRPVPRDWKIADWNNAEDQTAENVALTMEFAALCAEQAEKVDMTLALAEV